MVAEMQHVVSDLYDMLTAHATEREPYQLKLTAEMKHQMDAYFFTKGNLVEAMHKHTNASSVVRRRRFDFKRILFILTLYRKYELQGSWSEVLATKEIVPTMEDVDLCLYLVNKLIDHTLYVLDMYARETVDVVESRTDITKSEILHSLAPTFYGSEAKVQLRKIGDSNPDRTIRNWLKANLIARTGKEGRVHTYRKLSAKETQRQQSVSAKKLLKAKSC